MMRNVSEHGERVVVPVAGVRWWCQVVVSAAGARWWCRVLVPAGGARCWCRVMVSGGGVGCRCRVVVPRLRRSVLSARCPLSGLWCFELDNEKESAARTKTMIN